MPSGMGTYGSKKGRPPKKKKEDPKKKKKSKKPRATSALQMYLKMSTIKIVS